MGIRVEHNESTNRVEVHVSGVIRAGDLLDFRARIKALGHTESGGIMTAREAAQDRRDAAIRVVTRRPFPQALPMPWELSPVQRTRVDELIAWSLSSWNGPQDVPAWERA